MHIKYFKKNFRTLYIYISSAKPRTARGERECLCTSIQANSTLYRCQVPLFLESPKVIFEIYLTDDSVTR